MGLFGSNTVTTVGTSVSRVIEDDAVPNSLANGFAKNMFSEDGDQMTESMLEELSNSIGLRAERLYGFGEKRYLYGLPNSTLKTSAAGRDAALAAIQAQVGVGAELSYYHMGGFNNLHFGWKTLVETYDYDSTTNQFMVDSQSVYLKDMQVIVTTATANEMANGSMDQWGDPATSGKTPERVPLSQVKATPFAIDPGAQADYIRVDYCWSEPYTTQVEGITVTKSKVQNASLTFPIAAYDPSADYHHARYTLNGKAGYWTYLQGSGVEPAIDAVFNTEYATGGQFFPITYLRYAKTSATVDKTSEWYTQSVKMLGQLNMDFESIASAIDENPDIADVEQAMIMFAVPANTSNAVEQRYLFDFFSGIYDEMTPVEGATQSGIQNLKINNSFGNQTQDTSIIIQDKRFKMALSYKTIVRYKVAGKLGPVGIHSSGMNLATTVVAVPMLDGTTYTWTIPEKSHWYRRQISDYVYEEIHVVGLAMRYWIFEGYTVTADENDDILLIPLNLNITKQYTLPVREELYSRSMQYIFNSRVITKLKWYQTGLFRVVMIVVTIVITVLTYGETWQAMATAIAEGTVTVGAVIMALAIGVLKIIAMSFVMKLFVKAAGAKVAFIAAIVAAVFGMYQLKATVPIGYLPTGVQLLSVSTGLSKASSAQIQHDMNNLLGQASEFEQYVKDQTQLLKNTQELLDASLHVDPTVIYGESADDFYHRTVHSGNIGIVGVDVVSSYYDVALQLPKLNDSLGGSI